MSINDELKSLEEKYMEAKDKYYNSDKPIMTDYDFDILEDKIRELNPKSKVLKVVGMKVNNGIKLPYRMMSLNKRKDDEGIKKWVDKYNNKNVVLTDKLDGLSIIGIYERDKDNKMDIQLLTRGDGYYGLDISKIIKYIDIPSEISEDKMVIRGEIIMKKDIFESKYKGKYSNARNLVSGAILRKNINKNVMEDISVVWYAVYYPEKLEYTKQLELLSNNGFNIVNYTIIDKSNINLVNKENLTEYLKNRNLYNEYNIDGIVVQYDEGINKMLDKNPENAFAFKIDGEIKEVMVIGIEWNISKHNKMIPVIVIEPTLISGVIIEKITGNNAKYILDNKIGKGSIIKVVRSGEVIPKVMGVIKSKFSVENDFPKNYLWKDDYHIMSNKSEEAINERNIKMLDDSFKKLGVEGLNIATITKLYYAGYNTILKILNMKVEDLLKLDNFKETSSNKLYNNIQRAYNNASFEMLMDFSNLMGEGIAKKNIRLVLNDIPNIMELSKTISKNELIEKLNEVQGIGDKKALLIANNLNKFVKFYEKLPKQVRTKNVVKNVKIDNKFKNKKVVFSGVRDKNMEQVIEKSGGKVVNTISKEVDMLIVKDKTATSSKINKAKELNIEIINYKDL